MIDTGRTATAPTATKLLELDADVFRANYNRMPFLFNHRLDEHPLLQLENLVALANRLPADLVMHAPGKKSVADDFDAGLRGRTHPLSIDKVLSDMQNSDAYVLLHRVEEDPDYAELLDAVLGEVRELSEPLDPGMCEAAGYIFIASPGAVTPYHMDREVNFLCQVRGTKAVQLWDQDDPAILSESEKETLMARPLTPKPGYRPEFEPKAMSFEMGPGTGVHQPILAPHAMRNSDDDFSVAMAFTFRTKSWLRQRTVLKVNWHLRRLGLHPKLGRSAALDTLKYHGLTAVTGIKHQIRRS
jgi:hypothetical protein